PTEQTCECSHNSDMDRNLSVRGNNVVVKNMSRCEGVEMRNSADAIGDRCSRTASTQCSDCGSELCESHAETCGACRSIFCSPCFFFHREQHSKPAHGERRERKRA